MIISEFEAKNNEYLEKLINEEKVEIRKIDKETLQILKNYTTEVLEEITVSDPFTKKVYDSFTHFAKNIRNWAGYSEKLYHDW